MSSSYVEKMGILQKGNEDFIFCCTISKGNAGVGVEGGRGAVLRETHFIL
jgi:hypothetical protein